MILVAFFSVLAVFLVLILRIRVYELTFVKPVKRKREVNTGRVWKYREYIVVAFFVYLSLC